MALAVAQGGGWGWGGVNSSLGSKVRSQEKPGRVWVDLHQVRKTRERAVRTMGAEGAAAPRTPRGSILGDL